MHVNIVFRLGEPADHTVAGVAGGNSSSSGWRVGKPADSNGDHVQRCAESRGTPRRLHLQVGGFCVKPAVLGSWGVWHQGLDPN